MVVRSGRQEQVAAEQKEETRAPAERTSEPKSTDCPLQDPAQGDGIRQGKSSFRLCRFLALSLTFAQGAQRGLLSWASPRSVLGLQTQNRASKMTAVS